MLFKGFTILALAAAIQVLAAPAAEKADDDLVVIQSRPYGNGTLIVYGSATPSSVIPRSELAPQCGSNAVTCSGSHVADFTACNDLLSAVQNSQTTLSDSPRSLCLNTGGNQCCISWSTDIGTVTENNLYNAAQAVFNQCFTFNGPSTGGSGLARDVSINGQCLTECLSNRPDGCS